MATQAEDAAYGCTIEAGEDVLPCVYEAVKADCVGAQAPGTHSETPKQGMGIQGKCGEGNCLGSPGRRCTLSVVCPLCALADGTSCTHILVCLSPYLFCFRYDLQELAPCPGSM